VIDAERTGDVMSLVSNTQIVIEGFTLIRGANGLFINRATGVTLRRNRIAENIFSGIAMGINSNAENTITENIIDTNGSEGIFLFENSAAVITHNTIHDNRTSGIFNATASTAEITANTVTGSVLSGIVVYDRSEAIVTDNTVLDNRGIGIWVALNATATLTANTVTGSALSGIVVQDRSKAVVTNNTVRDNRGVGIFTIIDSTTMLTANTVMGSLLGGIAVQDRSESIITDNLVRDNRSIGILVQDRSEAIVTNNAVHNNGLVGIYVVTDSTATLTSNTVTGSALNGILIQDRSEAILTNNIVRDNRGIGIYIDGSVATISGGTIAQNGGHGVFLVGASSATIGLQGDVLTLTENGGAGIFVTDDGSLAHINRARIVFGGNGGGDIVGPVDDFPDADLDGLSDVEEALWGTDPADPDSDGDTFSDGVEVVSHSDPLASGSIPTTILYGTAHADPEGSSTLYAIDPTTGRAIRVGPIGFQRVSGMDADAAGTLYATGSSARTGEHVLLTIDPVTGVGTAVGPTGVEGLGFDTVTDLSFRSGDNRLYAYFGPGDTVGTLDLATGRATALGSSGVFCCGNGIAFSPNDLLFHANDHAFHLLNQEGDMAIALANLTFHLPADKRPRVNAMDFHPGTGLLFASLSDGSVDLPENYLATINTMTGKVIIIGRTVDGLDALAWMSVP
jgi:parallel beta-helix repeat protein